MHIGLLQFSLLIRSAESIKDKRRVVNSVKAKLHREHLVSVAEVGNLDRMDAAFMAVAIVNRDLRYMQGVLDSIERKLGALTEAELRDVSRSIIDPESSLDGMLGEDGQLIWTEAERRQADELASDDGPSHA